MTHDREPACLRGFASLRKGRLELLKLRGSQQVFQFMAFGRQTQQTQTPIQCAGFHFYKLHFNQLAQRCIQGLFGDLQRFEQLIHRDFGLTCDEIQNPMMDAVQPAFFQNRIWRSLPRFDLRPM